MRQGAICPLDRIQPYQRRSITYGFLACEARLFEVRGLRNVQLVKPRERPRLAFEAHQPSGIAGERLGQDLVATSRSGFVSCAR